MRLPVALLAVSIICPLTTLAAPVVENAFGMRFVELPAATFWMGSVDLAEARADFPTRPMPTSPMRGRRTV